ncbi:F-box domain [Arabidopsis thaliana x Arabidopsis arenosa]|uniref:F-box domain n=1 Tax=Arabidopsis thaliana x Arabidopsis arenosa TaxID=1240361 RepID=A0A8T2BIQ5_9BRAS|nr:F-box domain [Arabidopsis thaliana x Arabidopsis arenosa]
MVERKLPLDLEEEILFRVPPRSLLRFRSVCREWNTLFHNKRFINKNFACARPEFMLKTYSYIYSISVDLNDDPTINVRDLRFDHLHGRHYNLKGTCDGNFFLYDFHEGGGCVVSNPLLRQNKWFAKAKNICGKYMGYDGSRPEKSYKIIGMWERHSLDGITTTYLVSEFAANAYWKVTDHTSFYEEPAFRSDSSGNNRVSLNGNLYWTAHTYPETGQYFIRMLDFSKEIEKSQKTFCVLPCKKKKSTTHTRVLSMYKGDRFSVLEQSRKTREIEIWVTKDKIGNGDDGDNVVWIKFMTVSIPDFPMVLSHMSTKYFVDNNIYGKSFVLCCPSKRLKAAWVYIVRGDLCKKIKIDQVLCEFESSVYVPSLITIP